MSLRNTTWWQPVSVEPVRIQSGQSRMEGSSTVAFWGVFAYAFILFIAPQQIFPPLAHFRPAMIAVAFTVPAYVLAKLRTGQRIFQRSPGVIIVVWLAGWAVLMVPFSLWPSGSVQFLTSIFFKSLTLFLLLAHIIDSVDKLKKVAWLLVLFSILVSVTTISHFFHNVEPGLATKVVDRVSGYVSPMTQNPNDLALTLNLILPMCISLLVLSRRKIVRLFLAGVMCLDVFAIILSFSRGGFLTLCVIGAAYLWMFGRRAVIWAVPLTLLCAIAVVPFVPSSYMARLDTITHYQKDPTGSAQQRAGDMKLAARIALHDPIIGSGPGLDWLALNNAKTHNDDWVHVHDVYLQLAVDLGFPGLCLYLAFVYQTFKAAGRATQASGALGRLATGIRVSLIGFVLAAVFYPSAYYYYFYIFAGMAFAANVIYDAQKETRNESGLYVS